MTVWTMFLVAIPLAQLPDSPDTSRDTARRAAAQDAWADYEATVTSYLAEPAPPPPAAPAAIGLSSAASTAPAPAAACDPAETSGGHCHGACAGTCPHCKEGKLRSLLGGTDACDAKKLFKYSTCDLYPHYPYFPKDHGYYYFRPYNYIHVLTHQQTVVKLGGDPRNPYSTQLLANLFVNVEHPPTMTFLRQQENDLPRLEDLLDPKPAQ